MPIPEPWTTRTRDKPARNARSTNFSTSRVASSTVWPITLISLATLSSSSSFFSETEIPRARAAATGVTAFSTPAVRTTLAMSPRGTRIFIMPASTSNVFSSTLRFTTASRPKDLSRTVSPSATYFISPGRALGSPRSAPLRWATTAESNCSLKSRRRRAMRRSASFDSFCAAARSCTAFTASRD